MCQGIGGKIVLRDMNCQQAFEIIQSVFDIYDDWISGLLPVAGTEDYQRIVDESRQIFQNPVIFLDGDNRVLALSSQYGERTLTGSGSICADTATVPWTIFRSSAEHIRRMIFILKIRRSCFLSDRSWITVLLCQWQFIMITCFAVESMFWKQTGS